MSTQDGLEVGSLFVSIGLDTSELELGLGRVGESIADVGRRLVELGETPVPFAGLRQADETLNSLSGLTNGITVPNPRESEQTIRLPLTSGSTSMERERETGERLIQAEDGGASSAFGVEGPNDALSNCCKMLDACRSGMPEESRQSASENLQQKQLEKLIEIERGITRLAELVSAIARNAHPISSPI